MKELLGPRNPLVQQARLLSRDRAERTAGGLAVLEGVRLAEEALATGLHLEYALYTEGLGTRPRGADLLKALADRRTPLHPCSEEALSRAADTESPQGIVAIFRQQVWRWEQIGPGLVLILENVQDPGNLGTVLRSLDGMGGAGLVLVGGVDPYNPKVIRGAMGSLFRLPVMRATLAEAVEAVRASGRRLYAADLGGAQAPWQANLRGDAAVLVGNEGAGPSAEALAAVQGIISIPMSGGAESLNAGVAASLLAYEAMRQRAAAVAP